MLKGWLAWVLKIGFTAAVFGYLLATIDLEDAWRQARTMDLGMLAAAVAVLLLQFPIGARRWLSVLKAIGAPMDFRRVFGIYYIGCFFNLTLPSAVGGDAVRMWKARRAGLSVAAAVNSVMLERVATVFGLVLLVTVLQPLLLRRVELPGTWVFPALAGVSLAGILLLTVLDRLPADLRRWRVVRGLATLAHDARSAFLNAGNAGATLAWAILGHVNLSIVVYLLARGLDLGLGVLDCLVLVPPVILITTLPISIAGWGVREGAMVAALGFVGVPASAALVLSLTFGILNVLTSLPGGVVWVASGERMTAPAEPAPDA